MEKTISISALVVAVAASVVAVTKPDVTKMVAASQSEDDQLVTQIVQQTGGEPTQCCRSWVDIGRGDELGWTCAGIGYDPRLQAKLDKKANATGKVIQCIGVDPTELASGDVKVAVTLTPGEPPPRTVAAVAETPVTEVKEP